MTAVCVGGILTRLISNAGVSHFEREAKSVHLEQNSAVHDLWFFNQSMSTPLLLETAALLLAGMRTRGCAALVLITLKR